MKQLNFACDYMQGCVPSILEKMAQTNMEATPGYGEDKYTSSAIEKIRKACGKEKAEVKFLVGGTQANATVIHSLLRNYEGVISLATGHIAVHEAGAIEAGGHKVLCVEGKDGKIPASSVENYMQKFLGDETCPHMVQPGMVYISQPTEFGTLYSKKELQELSDVCHKYHLYLYVDGARLAYALGAEENDVSLEDLSSLSDVFYIGGTKCGTMFGEAIVVPDPNLIPHFFTSIKQSGALLAKGRMLGIQFDEMFTDDLYFEVGRKAVQYAKRIDSALKEYGYEMYLPTQTNQIFVNFEDHALSEIKKHVSVSFWEKTDATHTLIRLATSWGTSEEEVETLIKILKENKPE